MEAKAMVARRAILRCVGGDLDLDQFKRRGSRLGQ
jgi:hypothetical protein